MDGDQTAWRMITNKPQPNRWKTAFAILGIVAFYAIARMALKLEDQSATLSMVRDGFERRENALSVLRKSMPDLLRLSGHASQSDVLAILQKHNQGAPIVSGPSFIEMDQMRFCFASDGSFARIEKTDDYGTRASDIPTNRPTIP
jgi:hypothetical protein